MRVAAAYQVKEPPRYRYNQQQQQHVSVWVVLASTNMGFVNNLTKVSPSTKRKKFVPRMSFLVVKRAPLKIAAYAF